MNPPNPINTKLIIIIAQLFLSRKDGSERIVHLNIHRPGNMNIKTAARLPSNFITSPMFGITIASIKDRQNHTVTTT